MSILTIYFLKYYIFMYFGLANILICVESLLMWVVCKVKQSRRRRLCRVMVNVLDCDIVVSEFELQQRYYNYFRTNTLGKNMSPLVLPVMGQIVPLLFFYKEALALNNPRRLICHKTNKPDQTRQIVLLN